MAKEKYASTPREEPTSSNLGITKKMKKIVSEIFLRG